MRILIATENYHPMLSGAVVFIDNLANALIKRGHQVVIFAPAIGTTFAKEHRGKVVVYRFSSMPFPVVKKGQRLVYMALERVESIMAEFQPQILHIQSPSGLPNSAMKVAKKAKIPILGTHHFSFEMIQSYAPQQEQLSNLTKILLTVYLNNYYKHLELLTCPTDAIRQSLIEAGVTVPLAVVSNGIDVERFQSNVGRLSAKVPAKRPFVLYVGRIDKDKQIQVLLDAIPQVLKEVDVSFIFAGDGEYLVQAQEWVEKNHLEDKVVFLGRLESESPELKGLYAKATVFWTASSIETQCIALLEAFTHGLPAVGVRALAIPELIQDDLTGYLVQPGNRAGLARAVVKILKDAKLRDRLGSGALELVQQHRLEKTIDQFEELYQQLVAKPKFAKGKPERP